MNTKTTSVSRRMFLRHAGALSALGGGAPLALNLSLLSSASAYAATDYKALVCVFLRGGNDAFNTVLATDAASWDAYAATRGQGGTTLGLLPPGTAPNTSASRGSPANLGGVLPIAPARTQGRSFALHPLLKPLQRMFNNDKRLAVVANVGPLVVPTTKTDLTRSTHPRPPRLYSHNDQQSVWQSMAPEGASPGWGGRMGDVLMAANGHSLFTAIAAEGKAPWLRGTAVQPVRVTPAGALPYGYDANGSLYGSAVVGETLKQIGTRSRSVNRIEVDHSQVVQRSVDTHATLAPILPPAGDSRWAGTGTAGTAASLRYIDPITLKAADNPLATQLQTVARVMAAANGGGMLVRRQVFFVELGSFDTHDGQNIDHAQLLAQLAHALDYFDATLGNLGLRNAVTLFTASDFGRTFTTNGDGTDHGWGGHHFVMGGAVKGGDIYGRFPTLGRKNTSGNLFDSSADQLHNGVLLPSLAVEQLAATLGRWMGLSNAQLLDVLPQLPAFSTQDLGFMA